MFNLSNFEQSRLSQLRAYSFPSSFEEEATKVVASMTTSIRVAVYQSVCRKLLYFLGGETYSDDVGEIGFANVFSKILQVIH